MQKDLKFGMVLGLVGVLAGVFWLSTRPSLSTKARIPAHRQQATPAAKEALQKTEPLKKVEEKPAVRYHIVNSGETLSDISYKYYGTTTKWIDIFSINRELIKDPNRLRTGIRLIIPN